MILNSYLKKSIVQKNYELLNFEFAELKFSCTTTNEVKNFIKFYRYKSTLLFFKLFFRLVLILLK